MRFWKYCVLICCLSCDVSNDSNRYQINADTIVLNFGYQHESPTPDSLKNVIITDVDNNPIYKFVEDSVYSIKIKHSSGIKIKGYAKSTNIKINLVDSIYLLQTPRIDSLKNIKVSIGYAVDENQNILLYHHKFFLKNKSDSLVDILTRIDTIGYKTFKLIKKNPR
ncbi:MAG: hypothetical protein RLN79_08930 [Cytophagales bacterium]